MTYYIHPFLFYLLGVAGSIKCASIIFAILFVFAVIGFGMCKIMYIADGYGDEDDDDTVKIISKGFKTSCILLGICLSLALFTPSRETCQEMIVSSVVTHENVNGAIEKTKELVDYIVDKVNETESDNDND